MKLDPAVALVMTLFALMVGATSVSAFWGYTLGREALSGVTQPDIRRTGRTANGDNDSSNDIQEPGALKSEDEILERVTALMNGKSEETPPEFEPESAEDGRESGADSTNETSDASFIEPNESQADVSLVNYQQNLPISTENRQIVLSVTSVQRQGNVVRMGVSLQNVGDRPVEFLYSLMDVVDDQGQILGVSTDGLPQEVPPTGEAYEGAVTVPSVLLGASSTVSLRLTDYPSEQIELQINDIPITP